MRELAAGMASPLDVQFSADPHQQHWNIFMSARNGTWFQLQRSRLVGQQWLVATVMTRAKDDEQIVLYSSVPHDSPLIGEDVFDNAVREAAA